MRKLLARRRIRRKEDAEMEFWRGRADAEGGIRTSPEVHKVFCDWMGLDRAFFAGKRILDVGCGPRGSLEWADEAAERVGLDPLAERYRDLGIDAHAMRYVAGPAEDMPLPADHFDVVSTMNSLDHVDDLSAAISEIARVVRPGGLWLLCVEAGAEPTPTEPQTIPWSFLEDLTDWDVEDSWRFELGADHDIYGAWSRREPWTGGPGLLTARLRLAR